MSASWNYWSYQIPVWGNLKRASDSSRYVADIQKNTGRSVKYPGLVYNNAGRNAIQDVEKLANTAMRVFKFL